MVNKYIFREYDIRGKVLDDFPTEVVIQLGKGFGSFVKRNGFQEIALSGDIRLTTPQLMDEFKRGVLSTGVDVINLGILPTPANYYSMFKLEVGGAVQITGSHNPPEFNGFKMSLDREAVYGNDIQIIRKYIDNNDFDPSLDMESNINAAIVKNQGQQAIKDSDFGINENNIFQINKIINMIKNKKLSKEKYMQVREIVSKIK